MQKEFLKSLGLETDVIDKIFAENGKDVNAARAEVDRLKKDLETAKGKITDYETEIEGLRDSTGEAEKLKERVKELQKTIDDRKAADEAAEQDRKLSDRFGVAIGDAKFLNEFTKNGLFSEFKAAIADKSNEGKSDKEIYEGLIKDRDNLFLPKDGIPSVVSATGGVGTANNDSDIREIMGLPPLKN